ncbi:MAG: LUD domain-containing protein, partial [Dehalococcoidia bacterium]
MLDERDLSQEQRWHYQQLTKKCLKALGRNNIEACYARDRDEARSVVLGLIPEAATVGLGDSVTMLQAGITQEIASRWGERVFNPFRVGPQGAFTVGGRDQIDLMRQAASADVFLTGMNAITLDGKLVNTDGFGNRVGG